MSIVAFCGWLNRISRSEFDGFSAVVPAEMVTVVPDWAEVSAIRDLKAVCLIPTWRRGCRLGVAVAVAPGVEVTRGVAEGSGVEVTVAFAPPAPTITVPACAFQA